MPARLAPGRRGVLRIWFWLLMLLLAVGTLDPIGYSGFGDEPLYLQAARCIAAHGYCLPETHWAARFPLVAPVGWSLRMLGEGYGAVMVAPLLYAAAAVLLLIANVRHRFGARAAGIAGTMLILTPAFASRASVMSIDVVELAWSLAAVLAWQVAAERRQVRFALLAGALLGVAVISRQTALAFAAVLAAGTPLLTRSFRPLAIAAAAGFAGMLAAEALFHLAVDGDALLGWRLSLGHTRIPSTELSAAVDLRESPLFNPDFIGGWRRHAGIELHWTVDGALNLLASAESGLTLACAVLLGWVAWPSLSADERSCTRRLGAAAVMHFALLTYALAVNPTPRMFLIEAAIAAAIIGVAASRRWRDGSRALIAAAALLMVARGILAPIETRDMRMAGPIAADWARTAAAPVTLAPVTATVLALSTGLADLSTDPSRARSLIALDAGRCQAPADAGSGWRLVRRAVVPERRSWREALGGAPREPAFLCQFSRSGPAPRPPA